MKFLFRLISFILVKSCLNGTNSPPLANWFVTSQQWAVTTVAAALLLLFQSTIVNERIMHPYHVHLSKLGYESKPPNTYA